MGEQGRRTVIGIGINLNHTAEDLPERPQFPASSLLMLTEREWPVKEILPLILAELESAVEALERGEWGQLLDSFNQRCAGIGDVVQVQNGEDRILGVLQEVDPEGRLVIRTADGPKTVVVGDVSYL
jgi:BirA family biotin operon repressor/biotin-[acetyl-CoA-carboxylase] ligase